MMNMNKLLAEESSDVALNDGAAGDKKVDLKDDEDEIVDGSGAPDKEIPDDDGVDDSLIKQTSPQRPLAEKDSPIQTATTVASTRKSQQERRAE